MATSSLREITGEEIAPGARLQSDEELLDGSATMPRRPIIRSGPAGWGRSARRRDRELRVHGIEGLRVADASIMPTLTSGNTNAPAIMIGEKCAEMALATQQQRARLLRNKSGNWRDHGNAADERNATNGFRDAGSDPQERARIQEGAGFTRRHRGHHRGRQARAVVDEHPALAYPCPDRRAAGRTAPPQHGGDDGRRQAEARHRQPWRIPGRAPRPAGRYRQKAVRRYGDCPRRQADAAGLGATRLPAVRRAGLAGPDL